MIPLLSMFENMYNKTTELQGTLKRLEVHKNRLITGNQPTERVKNKNKSYSGLGAGIF